MFALVILEILTASHLAHMRVIVFGDVRAPNRITCFLLLGLVVCMKNRTYLVSTTRNMPLT